MKNTIEISDIVGQIANLYYCNDANCFQLGSVKFEVLEDEDDGYRSSMDCLAVLSTNSERKQLLAEVKIVDISTNDKTMYALRDTKDSSFNWVEFGTENTDDYYPYFVFRTNVRRDLAVEKEALSINELTSKFKD